jgi:hypothetical protein
MSRPGPVIIDEIQKTPALLDVVHRLIERRRGWRFILTGSSARKLRRGGVNLLCGREEVQAERLVRRVADFARFLEAVSFSHAVTHPKFYFFDAGGFRSVRPAGPLDRAEEIDGAALEVKNTARLRDADLAGLRAFREDHPRATAVLLYRGTERLREGDVWCLPLEPFLRRLHPDRSIAHACDVSSRSAASRP